MTEITIAQDNRLTTAVMNCLIEKTSYFIFIIKEVRKNILLELFSVIYLMIQFEN
jgi:hypothetical protein